VSRRCSSVRLRDGWRAGPSGMKAGAVVKILYWNQGHNRLHPSTITGVLGEGGEKGEGQVPFGPISSPRIAMPKKR